MLCQHHIEQYMARYCGVWLQSYQSDGILLAQKDIVFVCGFTTTTTWEVSTWRREKLGREGLHPVGILEECLGRVAAAISCGTSRHSSESAVRPVINAGPEGRTLADGGQYKSDQYIFLDLGKTKTRHVLALRMRMSLQRRFYPTLLRLPSFQPFRFLARQLAIEHPTILATGTSSSHPSDRARGS